MKNLRENTDPELIPIADYCVKHELALNLLYAETMIEIDKIKSKSKGLTEGQSKDESFIKHCLYFYHHVQDVVEIYEQEKILEMIRRYKEITLN